MARRGSAQTLTLHVYRGLRADIVSGRVGPGSRLRPAGLAERFEVSLGVVREALARLAAERLVQVEPNRGFSVAPLSEKALTELVETRRVNESFALRLAIQRGDLAWESEVLAAHHRLKRTPMFSPDDPDHRTDEWSAAHSRFHATLVAACGNELLLEICGRLSDAGEIYRSLTATERESTDTEHRELMQAVLARDVERASELCQNHIQKTADMLLASRLLAPAAGDALDEAAGTT